MQSKKTNRTKTAALAIVFLIAAAAVILIANLPSPTNQSSSEYWHLNISPTTGANIVTPNGTIAVPMNQSGITVTADATGWNGFIDWVLDGKVVNAQSKSSKSSTVFIPRQEENSSHTLEARFVVGTPPLFNIVDDNFTVNPESYKAYNFTLPPDISSSQVTGTFNVTTNNASDFRVFIWDNAAFTNWKEHGASLHLGYGVISFYESGWATNGAISSWSYPSGTYWLIYINNSTMPTNVTSQASFYYIPK